ncbi:MAG TPA: hypothetical protein VGH16_03005 [Candidatus Binatia bacterium]|jgi:hypothetical protein
MNDDDEAHMSIRIALPRHRCSEVRDVIEVLSALEDVYDHVYTWHELACAADAVRHAAREAPSRRSLPDLADVHDLVPVERRLCLARIEVEEPAFVEVVGARYPLEVIYSYLRERGNGNGNKKVCAVERIEPVCSEIDHLCESSLPESEIQEALSRHLIAPLKRLERLEGIHIYDNDEPGKAPVPRRRSDRPPVDISPLAREH